MFPWSPEFAWDAAHVVFFGAFYLVLTAIAGALGVAAWRSARALREGRAAAVAWEVDFEDLPRTARACRHQLTGEAPGRTCENAFECGRCAAHDRFEARRHREGGTADTAAAPPLVGFDLPLDRYYHRGHTWARIEPDCTAWVGLDELAKRLLGGAEPVALPAVGTKLQANAPLARLRVRGREVRVLSPIDGTVVAVRGSGVDLTVCVVPPKPVSARHLLWGEEARAWAVRELERLQLLTRQGGAAPALADGGELVPDLGAVIPAERYDDVLGSMLLEP